MNISLEKVDNEIKLWENYYNNYENLAIQIMADILAHYKPEKRKDLIKQVEESISTLEEPINGQLMYECIKGDIESLERISDEAKIAIRTLTSVKDGNYLDSKDYEEEIEENK